MCNGGFQDIRGQSGDFFSNALGILIGKQGRLFLVGDFHRNIGDSGNESFSVGLEGDAG